MQPFEWDAPEYIHTDKTTDWYWIVGIVAISIALIAIILDDAIFGIFIIIAAFTLSLYASREPNEIHITISDRGVQSGDTLYLYEHLKSYWVETGDRYPRVLIKSEKVFMPYITLLLGDADPDRARDALAHHLPEEKHAEPLLAKVLIYLGF